MRNKTSKLSKKLNLFFLHRFWISRPLVLAMSAFIWQAHAQLTYRLKVIDETAIQNVSSQNLRTLADLEQFTKIIDIPTQWQSLPTPVLSTDTFYVCLDSCSQSSGQIRAETNAQGIINLVFDVASAEFRQVNVFYHLLIAEKFFRSLGFRARIDQRFPVYVDRKIKTPLFKEEMKNNAFFDSQEYSLSFVPSKIARRLLGIKTSQKFLDTSYDPSVIAHEYTHLVFHNLVAEQTNEDYHGMHEGLADFFAASIYNLKDFAAIFGFGHPLRELKGSKKYFGAMEAHDSGEVYVQLLNEIQSRLNPEDRHTFAQNVFESLACVDRDIFASYSLGIECLLHQLKERGAEEETLGVIASLSQKRNIGLDRDLDLELDDTIERSPVRGRALIYQERISKIFGQVSEQNIQYVKVAAIETQGDYTWYQVKTNDNLEKLHSDFATEFTTVLIHTSHSRLVRAYNSHGQALKRTNVAENLQSFGDARALKGLFESENLISSQPAIDSELPPHTCQLPGLEVSCRKMRLGFFLRTAMNTLLKLSGMNVRIRKLEYAKAAEMPLIDGLRLIFFRSELVMKGKPKSQILLERKLIDVNQ